MHPIKSYILLICKEGDRVFSRSYGARQEGLRGEVLGGTRKCELLRIQFFMAPRKEEIIYLATYWPL